MANIKLALKNIVRVPGRSILIALTMVIIVTSILVSLAINSGTNQTLTDVRQQLGNDVTLKVNMQYIQRQAIENMKNGKVNNMEIEPLTEELADKYIKSKYITDYDYESEIALTTDHKVVGESSKNNESVIMGGPNSEMPKLKLVANLKSTYQREFKDGNKQVVEGRFYNEQDIVEKKQVVVISKNLADLNDLKVGDNLAVKGMGNDNSTINLEIIGLYEDKVQNDNFIPFPYVIRDNELYTPLSTAKELFNNSANNSSINSATYFINDPKNMEAFKKEVIDSNLNQNNFALDANDRTYNKMVGPLQKLNSIIKIFLIIIILTGAIIMALIMTLTTRERKLEIGILRSLGVKRRKIALQFIVETLVIVMIALSVGVVFGNALSQGAADYLLQKEVAAVAKTNNQTGSGFGEIVVLGDSTTNASDVDVIDNFNTQIKLKEILTLVIISLIIAGSGIIVSSYFIMKYEPMKILSNRV